MLFSVIPSEVEGSRRETFKVASAGSLDFARDDGIFPPDHGSKIENEKSKIDRARRDRVDRRLQIGRAGQFAGETESQCFPGDDK